MRWRFTLSSDERLYSAVLMTPKGLGLNIRTTLLGLGVTSYHGYVVGGTLGHVFRTVLSKTCLDATERRSNSVPPAVGVLCNLHPIGR